MTSEAVSNRSVAYRFHAEIAPCWALRRNALVNVFATLFLALGEVDKGIVQNVAGTKLFEVYESLHDGIR